MASAYMVMYKKVDSEGAEINITDEEIPDYITEDIAAEDIKLQEESCNASNYTSAALTLKVTYKDELRSMTTMTT